MSEVISSLDGGISIKSGEPELLSRQQFWRGDRLCSELVWVNSQDRRLGWVADPFEKLVIDIDERPNPIFHVSCQEGGEELARLIVADEFDRYWAIPLMIPKG